MSMHIITCEFSCLDIFGYSLVCVSVCSSTHKHTHASSRLSTMATFGLPASQVRSSKQALSLSGLSYRCGNSVVLIKASFNKGGVCVRWDLASPTPYEKKTIDWD